MNNLFLKILKRDVLNFVKNATEEDCSLIVEKFYSKGFYEYIQSLRAKSFTEKESTPISFIAQFPEQATKLPCYSFVLGNVQADTGIQTFSYETEELTDEEYVSYRHLVQTFEDNKINYINTKSIIHTSQVIVGCYANNKIEVSWLLHLADFIIKMRTEQLSAIFGLIDLSIAQTDLRLQQELFPLAVPTRILTVNFKYEKIFPRLDESKAVLAEFITFLEAEDSQNLISIKN